MTKKIVLTGPESTAKSTLSRQLAAHYHGIDVPEFARQYLAERGADYSYADVEAIAREQVKQYELAVAAKPEFVFFDTWLIVTKVWFDWVYQRVPAWLEKAIADLPVDLYLLCRPDIAWEPDPLRENGGEERLKLFEIYKEELQQRGLNFVEIGGEGDERFRSAQAAVKQFAGTLL